MRHKPKYSPRFWCFRPLRNGSGLQRCTGCHYKAWRTRRYKRLYVFDQSENLPGSAVALRVWDWTSTKAQRFSARPIQKIFSAPINTGRDQAQTICIASHSLTRWEGTENDPWKLLPGLEERKTALSDHLHELFEGWTVDYLFTKGEYTGLFEGFELLGTLAYITLSNDKATLQAAVQNPNGDFVWSPIGRAAWDGSVRRKILGKLDRRPAATTIEKPASGHTSGQRIPALGN